MTQEISIQAAGSSSRMDKGANDVDMKDVNATGKAGKEGEFFSSAKPSQENKTTAPIDGEKPAGSNKRKRNSQDERLAKRQKKEEITADQRAAAAIPEPELAFSRAQKVLAKAKRREERLAARMKEKARRREEHKRRELEHKKSKDARKKDLQAIQALEKQIKELKAKILIEDAKKVKGKKRKLLDRSWKHLEKGIVLPGSLEEKIAVAKASVARAKAGVNDDVPMEAAPKADSPKAGDAKKQNEVDEKASEVAATEHLIEDSPESAIESESVPAQTEKPEFDSEVPEQSSEEKVREKVDSEIPDEEHKDQEEGAEESSPAAQEKDQIEEGTPKEDAAPVVPGTEMELEEPKEEVEANASAKKRSRKRVKNNNRLDAEETPTKPTTPASSNSQKAKAPVAKKGRPPTKPANNANTASESPEESVDVDAPKAKRGRVPKSRAAALASTTTTSSGLDSPARNTRSQLLDISSSHHNDDMVEAIDDQSEGTGNTPRIHNDAIHESITCEPWSTSNSEFQTPSKMLHSFDNMELAILQRTDAFDLYTHESDSSELSELNIPDYSFLASDSSAVDITKVDTPSIISPGKKQRPPAHSPYFARPPAATPSKSKIPITLQEEAPVKNFSPKKESPKKRPAGIISCIPFPPLSAPHFGLIQEKLVHDPFRLLIAVTFLNRTHGKHAIPVFYNLMDQYPTPQSIADAPKEEIISVIRHLGLQNQRAATYQTYAKIFCENPPIKSKRYAVHNYPTKGLGRDVKKSEVLPVEVEDPRTAWEIGHITQGPYALDSWRIFCRDILLGKAQGWNGEGNHEEGFQPEWMRVVPEDKKLRAFLGWMWLKEGFEWDPFTGEKEVAGTELLRAAMEGRIVWDDAVGMRIFEAEGDGEGKGDGDGVKQD
ncbi:hypothetical protein DSL72_008233 [Monilinia vaccinii-corymbosi]|uniref:HhH-GPD domain-containing protein n=1 Tax=Monilinia vaccinii-corymbosi TaxID=61207 RepID=A0A8A3PK20_9HELO|nr:hypothetical protein DSL72_008233 [Monilinia vaccinii-corymbosi]